MRTANGVEAKSGGTEGREEGLIEGGQRGTIKTHVSMIENLLPKGIEWAVIERVSGVDEKRFQAVK